ncbi:AMP-binding protein [Streptomyces sp. SD11]|uniref:AMP-binding protein n=1 Tax=Streptomyces sp. SD11 TaxID=3452209 RepID=UPI003F898437
MADLAQFLTETARRSPDRTALRFDTEAYDNAGLETASAQAAAMLRARGVRPGDRVTLFDIRCVAEDDSVGVRLLGETGRDVAPGSIGELSVHGHNVLKGYWNRPQRQDSQAPDHRTEHDVTRHGGVAGHEPR